MKENEWFFPKEKLPDKGQRVRVLVIKELIYAGNEEGESSAWTYDGLGAHKLIQWQEIKADDE